MEDSPRVIDVSITRMVVVSQGAASASEVVAWLCIEALSECELIPSCG